LRHGSIRRVYIDDVTPLFDAAICLLLLRAMSFTPRLPPRDMLLMPAPADAAAAAFGSHGARYYDAILHDYIIFFVCRFRISAACYRRLRLRVAAHATAACRDAWLPRCAQCGAMLSPLISLYGLPC